MHARGKDDSLLSVDPASLDLQLSLPGMDRFQAAYKLAFQIIEVTQFMLNVIVKTLFTQA